MAMSNLRSVFFVLTMFESTLSAPSECDPHENIEGASVWLPGENGFDEKRLDQYARFQGTAADANAKLDPGLLVSCSNAEQVKSALAFGKQCGYSVVIRGGGHSYTGLSSCNTKKCMLLDTSTMNHISVDDNLITAGPGARLVHLFETMGNNSVALPHGVCTNVGLGGHLQSSAYGPLSHAYGSGMDHVESFKMVLSNSTLIEVSRHDEDSTLYTSILGSAPGSWGVITEYTLRGLRDRDVPTTHMLRAQYNWTKAKFVAVIRHIQWIAKDQEERNLRDMRVILFAAPPSQGNDTNMYVRVHCLWTGVDSGDMTKGPWHELYVQPLLDLKPQQYTDIPNVPLSKATRLIEWENHDDRYAIQDFISDTWWSNEFIDLIAEELDERHRNYDGNLYSSFQYNPLGTQSQWARNAGMNALTWRNFRAYADDWVFVKKDSLYGEAVKRMRDFREKTREFWQFKDGSERSTWMSPRPNATDLRNATIARQFFPNSTQFQQLQSLKAKLDPEDLFSTPNTVPLPASVDLNERIFVV